VPRRRCRDRGQFVLGLEHQGPPSPAILTNPQGLVAALADLLLAALGVQRTAVEGGNDEPQDHS
jgi:hypothetical protein